MTNPTPTPTEQRLARLEQRLEALEQLADKWQASYARFLAGPGRKIARMLGIEPPP